MGKTEMVKAIAEKAGISQKDAKASIEAFEATVKETLADGGKVALIGFGTFEVRDRAARNGVNPATKEPIQIAATKVPAFKASAVLKAAVK